MPKKIQTPLSTEKPRRSKTGYLSIKLRRAVIDASKEFNCSESFIIAVAVANLFNIKNQERYY